MGAKQGQPYFVDGKTTLVNPNTPLNMGYNTTSRVLLCSPPTGKRKSETSKLDKTQKKEATIKENVADSKTFDDELDKNEIVAFDLFDQKEK